MNWISGIIMLCGVAGMAFWFRPRERDSLLLCGIGLILFVPAILGLIAGGKLLQAANIRE